MTKVYVAKTENTGKGLFAKTDIKKNEAIFSVQGRIIKESKYYAGSYYKTGPRWLTIGKNTWVSPLRSNPWWFINHSCKPNAGLRGKVTVVAMKNIKKGSEITIDYSITEDYPSWQMKCECSHNNCRKVIRSVRFLPDGIFKKYKPFIPKFLQESYLSSRNV
ncbi:SET domain-containing protein [Candidatus Woesearchaeota archaeon]|nr:SET domain-containing protein [Candidatus Woesearchaeota archaeon]